MFHLVALSFVFKRSYDVMMRWERGMAWTLLLWDFYFVATFHLAVSGICFSGLISPTNFFLVQDKTVKIDFVLYNSNEQR